MRLIPFAMLSLAFVVNGQVQDSQPSLPIPYIQQGPYGPTSLSTSPNGILLASGDLDGVRIYNLRFGREILTLPQYAVKSVAFSPDGKWLASSGQDEAPGSDIRVIHFSARIWPIVNGTITPSAARFINACSPSTGVGAVAFAPDSRVLAIACDDQEVVLSRIDADTQAIRIKLPTSANCLQFSPEGTTLATGLHNGITTIWNSSNGVSIRSFGAVGSAATAIAYTADGKTLAVSREAEIGFWNASDGTLVRTIAIPKSTVSSMSFQPSGKFLATGGYTGVSIFDVARGTISKTFHPFFTNVTAVTYTPDGSELAGAAWSQVAVWNSQGDSERYIFRRQTNGVSRLVFSQDRKTLVADSQIDIKAWDYQSGVLLGTVSNAQSASGLRSPDDKHFASIIVNGISVYRVADGVLERTFPGHDPITTAIAFTPDSKVLASGGVDGLVRIWGLLTGPPLVTIDTNDPERKIEVVPGFSVSDPRTVWKNIISCLVFSDDGQWIAGVASNGSNGQMIHIWDAHTGREIRRLLSSSFVSALAFDPTRKQLASADNRGIVTLWNIDMGTASMTLTADTSAISALLFDPGRNLLISGSANGEILVWDLSKRSLLVRLVSTGSDDWLAIAPDGLFDGTSEAMRQVGWRVGSSQDVIPLESFYNDFFEPNIYAKTVSGHPPKPPIDLLTDLQLPGLRAMLAEELVHIELKNGQPTLCLMEFPTVTPMVFRDAQPMHFNPEDLVPHPGDSLCPFGLLLDSNVQYEVASKSGRSNRHFGISADKIISVGVSSSTLHVQAIAVENYDFKTTGLKSLPSSVRGAQSLEALFREPRQKNGPYQKVRVWNGLYDQDATRQGIMDRLREIGRTVSPKDVLLVFLSGHGMVPAGQEMFYFAPFDFTGPDPMRERETGLNTAMLVDAMRNLPAARIILIIDTCQSGGAIESLEKMAMVKSDLTRGESGTYLIASSTPLEVAIAPTTGEDALVSTLLDALRIGATGPAISIRDVTHYVRKELPLRSKDPKHRETPIVVEVGVDFPITLPEGTSNPN